MENTIFELVDAYIADLFVQQDDTLDATVQSIVDNDIPQISISANQGKFLHMLALLSKSNRILEVGTLAGYSTIWMARALPENGKLISIEYEPKHAEVARKNIKNAGLSHKVEIIQGKASEVLDKLIAENIPAFDMIFIDADKPPYAEYFLQCLKLAKSGTLIIADNVIRDGKVLDETPEDDRAAGVKRFNKVLSESQAVSQATILQMVGTKSHDGMALAIVK
jgi:caffeoyl-CoA O-methyltransferase